MNMSFCVYLTCNLVLQAGRVAFDLITSLEVKRRVLASTDELHNQSALHVAFAKENENAVLTLLSHGASLSLRDKVRVYILQCGQLLTHFFVFLGWKNPIRHDQQRLFQKYYYLQFKPLD